MGGRAARTWLERVLVLVASGWIVRRALEGEAFTVDDAYIVVRYAENLVRAGQLAFDVGAKPVEGTTSLVGVAIAAVATAVHASAIGWLKAAGAIAAIAQPFLLRELGRELRAPAPASGLAALASASLAEHGLHAPSGLETELFAAAGLLLLWTGARALRSQRAPAWPAAIAATALVLTRPEGLVPAAILLGLVLLRRRREAVVPVAVGFGAPLAAVTVLRVVHFGALLPNTFHAKAGAFGARIPGEMLGLFLDVALGALVAAATLAVVARVSRVLGPRIRGRTAWLAAASFAVLVVFALAYARAIPIMDYGRRFAFHGLPWMSLLALALFGAAVSTALRLGRRTSLGPAAVALVLVATVTASAHGQARAEAVALHRERALSGVRALYVPAAAWIGEHVARGSLLAVYPDAGLVPLVTGLRTVDFGRLNDAYLAREAKTPSDVAAYFFARDPDALMLTSPGGGVPFDDGAAAILADPRFARRYLLARRFEHGGASLDVYARKP